MISDTLTDELTVGDDCDLDATNDLEYLLGLVGDQLEDADYEDDAARAKCAVAEWCEMLGYIPDTDEYEAGQSTPPDDMRKSASRR